MINLVSLQFNVMVYIIKRNIVVSGFKIVPSLSLS